MSGLCHCWTRVPRLTLDSTILIEVLFQGFTGLFVQSWVSSFAISSRFTEARHSRFFAARIWKRECIVAPYDSCSDGL